MLSTWISLRRRASGRAFFHCGDGKAQPDADSELVVAFLMAGGHGHDCFSRPVGARHGVLKILKKEKQLIE
jgi:hypothetical protein